VSGERTGIHRLKEHLMNRLTIAAAIAAGACAISIPAAALASTSLASHSPVSSHSRIVEDRSGPSRGSDDRGTSVEPGDDHGRHHHHHGHDRHDG
jgi:hypothetical protein